MNSYRYKGSENNKNTGKYKVRRYFDKFKE
jgi:hypothetical protein